MESIKIWMNVKAQLYSERRVPGSEKLTALDLAVYRAREFVTISRGQSRAFCLVGDSAFGVPFFRALNNGLLCGTKLAEELARIADSEFESLEPLNRYFTSSFPPLRCLPSLPSLVKPSLISLLSSLLWLTLLHSYNSFVSDLANAEIEAAKRKKIVLKSASMISPPHLTSFPSLSPLSSPVASYFFQPLFRLFPLWFMLGAFVSISGAVPWQVNKWGQEKVKQFKETDPGFYVRI